jgi:hypothetical protein
MHHNLRPVRENSSQLYLKILFISSTSLGTLISCLISQSIDSSDSLVLCVLKMILEKSSRPMGNLMALSNLIPDLLQLLL